MPSVGILALQGSFNEHIAALRRIGVKGVELRKAEQLENVNGLIIPGGESTTMAKLAHYHNLFPALRDFVKTGKPVWGTCAGLIFLAHRDVGQKLGGQELVGGLDCTVHWNFFGSQLQSFETELLVPELAAKEGGPASFRGVFICVPAILEAGPDVEVLAYYSAAVDKSTSPKSSFESQEEKTVSEEEVIVAIKQGNLLGTAFHPELTADTRWHSFFLKMVSEDGDLSSSSATTSEGNVSGYQQVETSIATMTAMKLWNIILEELMDAQLEALHNLRRFSILIIGGIGSVSRAPICCVPLWVGHAKDLLNMTIINFLFMAYK